MIAPRPSPTTPPASPLRNAFCEAVNEHGPQSLLGTPGGSGSSLPSARPITAPTATPESKPSPAPSKPAADVVAVDHDRFQRLERHLAVASVGRLELDPAADEMRTGCILESLRG